MHFKSKLSYPRISIRLVPKYQGPKGMLGSGVVALHFAKWGTRNVQHDKEESEAIIGREKYNIYGGMGTRWVVVLVYMKSRRKISKGLRLSCRDEDF